MTKIYDGEFDPLGALQVMAAHQEEISRQVLELTKAYQKIITHTNNQTNLIDWLEQRIKILENQNGN